jgi:hypothetical protein
VAAFDLGLPGWISQDARRSLPGRAAWSPPSASGVARPPLPLGDSCASWGWQAGAAWQSALAGGPAALMGPASGASFILGSMMAEETALPTALSLPASRSMCCTTAVARLARPAPAVELPP